MQGMVLRKRPRTLFHEQSSLCTFHFVELEEWMRLMCLRNIYRSDSKVCFMKMSCALQFEKFVQILMKHIHLFGALQFLESEKCRERNVYEIGPWSLLSTFLLPRQKQNKLTWWDIVRGMPCRCQISIASTGDHTTCQVHFLGMVQYSFYLIQRYCSDKTYSYCFVIYHKIGRHYVFLMDKYGFFAVLL